VNPITYSLCQKPIIGAVMWVTSLCVFPPLFSGEPINLSVAESIASKAFVVPVDKKYALEVTFEFESIDARLNDQVVGNRFDERCLGDVRYAEVPEIGRAGLGRSIPFKVVVKKANDHAVVLERTFVSLCATSHDLTNKKTRTIGWLELKRGDYAIEVKNLQSQPDLELVRTYISLTSGQGK
jgi:hypothetical protein